MKVWILFAFTLTVYIIDDVHAEIKDEFDIDVKNITNVCVCEKESIGCIFDDKGSKKCICKEGFAQKGEQCEKCDCGEGTKNCTFDDKGNKNCTCKWNFAFKRKSNQCEICDCGVLAHDCDFDEKDNKVCTCGDGYKVNKGMCQNCYCGMHSRGCDFVDGEKKCDCFPNYKMDSLGSCEECQCGVNSSWCEYQDRTKVCTCDRGYAQQIVSPHRCAMCDCGTNSISCELTYDEYTRCTCKEGYETNRIDWDENEYCRLPEKPFDWMPVVYIAVSLVFFLVVVTIAYGIYRNRN